ncbi:MAG: hypothetical protein AOA66_0256 [Candidatus Bathyarchaeota archaeon BA2]|nr:MAG: hypothetical protein AOA66_0256 [Candidatus Bathyarchaeota archaeon BA2]
MDVLFESDSEYGCLFSIHILPSYKLNSTFIEVFTQQKCMMLEVIEMTKRIYAMETLDNLLLKVVDETLMQVFREAGAKVIYDYLENNSHLKLEEIAEKPEVFSAGLEKLLSSGASVIEKLVLKNMYHKLELKFEEKKGYGFSDYVKKLRKSAVVKA